MLKCKVCAEKDRLISQLQAEISYLRPLALPQNDPYNLPRFEAEADHALSGSDEPLPQAGRLDNSQIDFGDT